QAGASRQFIPGGPALPRGGEKARAMADVDHRVRQTASENRHDAATKGLCPGAVEGGLGRCAHGVPPFLSETRSSGGCSRTHPCNHGKVTPPTAETSATGTRGGKCGWWRCAYVIWWGDRGSWRGWPAGSTRP